MPKKHEECRLSVCLLCMGKSKDMRKLNETHRVLIEKYFIKGYDRNNWRLPLAICGTCRLILQDYSKGNFSRKIKLFDHSKIEIPPWSTTRSRDCECTVCQISRASTTFNFSKTIVPLRQKSGRPSSTVTSNSESIEKPNAILLCNQCLTNLKQGKEHYCTKRTRNKNLQELAKKGTPKSKEKLASAIIKDKIKLKPTGAVHQVSLATSTGRQLSILLSPGDKSTTPKESPLCKKVLFTTEDISKMQVDMNLSSNQTLRLASHIRTATQTRKSIEVNLKQKLSTINHKLDQYFDVIGVDYLKKGVGINSKFVPSPQSTVYCTNLKDFISYVLKHRQYSKNYILKIGVDGGGGFMKVCLTIQQNLCQEVVKKSRLSYMEGVAARNFKDSSVKRLFIIAIAPDVQENYQNLLKLWILLQLSNDDIIPSTFIATDLKLANIILGLNAHGSSHPCSWCDSHKEMLSSKGELRTLGNIIEKFWAWFEAGSDYSKAKNFGNCVHLPILKGSAETKIIDLVPPPELHLLLGPVNTMFKAMQKEWPEAIVWAKTCYVEREAMHGGSFDGNSCHILLNKLDVLQSLCPLQCLKYLSAFRDFDKVVQSCYGTELDPNYKVLIDNFKKSYLDLNINVTPKIHTVFYHIIDFCELKQLGLGYWSEQASEAVHSDFKSTWLKYKVVDEHPEYASKLLQAIRDYNCKHL